MYIPIIYLLFSAEILFILLAFSSGLLIYVYKLSQRPAADTEDTQESNETPEGIDLSTSYAEYLEQEIERNQHKLKQQARIEAEDAAEESDTENPPDNPEEATAEDNEETETNTENETAKAPDEAQSQLLAIREMFLDAEKSAAEYKEHEIHFWEQIYKGMEAISEKLTTIIHKEHKKTEMDIALNESPEVKEKVFYIETQGKKVDGEVNKLKDIIYEQENAINALRKSVTDTDGSDIDPKILEEINGQISALEAQLNDSKMCMEVLEMENERLQSEVEQLEAQYMQQLQNTPAAPAEPPDTDSTIDLSELQDLVDKQESQINELNSTIDELKMDAEMASKMKQTISDFARSSQEMMGCISILEDENKHFKQLLEQQGIAEDAVVENQPASEDMDELKSRLQSMEEEIIKKDVAYAQLQEEFDSMEKEYLSMYEALHGDNG